MTARSKVTATDDSCEVSKTKFPAGHVAARRGEQGLQGHRGLRPLPGRPHRHRAREHRPRHQGHHHRRGEGRFVRDRLQARHEGRRHPAEGQGHRRHGRQAQPRDGQGRRRATARTCRSRPTRRCRRSRSSRTPSRAGDIEAAKKAYAASRIGWERTEPVAESFGDIDPKVDVREDGLEERPEVDRLAPPGEGAVAGQEDRRRGEGPRRPVLDKDLADWQKRVGKAEITPTSMANGAKELLDEVATGKVTGEEERYSHTDLVDFKANVEGAQKSYELLKPIAVEERRGADHRAGQAVRGAEHAARQVPRGQDLLRVHLVRQGRQGGPQGALGRASTRSPSRCRKLAAAVDEVTGGEAPVMSEESQNTTGTDIADAGAAEPDATGGRAPSRRSLLGWGGAGLALGAAAAGGAVAAVRTENDAVPAAGQRRRGAVPRRAPGRYRHRRPGPAALRRVRREDEGPRRAVAAAQGLDAGAPSG